MLGERFEENSSKISRGNVDFEAIPLNDHIFKLYCAIGIILQKTVGYVWTPIANLLRSKILRLCCSADLRNKIASFKPEVIIAEDMYAAPVSSMVAQEFGVGFVYRIHHLYTTIYLGHVFESLLRNWEFSVMKKTDLLLTLTSEDKEEVNRIFEINAEVSGYGVNLADPSKGLNNFNLKENEYVLYVSSYLGKELDLLRKAASFFPSTTFVFVGQGSLALTNLPKNIRRLGLVSEQDLSVLYKYCRFVLVPFEWKPGQGVPVKLIEAVNSNKPVLLNEKASWFLHGISDGIYTFTANSFYKQMETLLHSQMTIERDPLLFNLEASLAQLEMQLLKMRRSKDSKSHYLLSK
jgi:hypothetical protein